MTMYKLKTHRIQTSMTFTEDIYLSIKEQAESLMRSFNKQATYWILLGRKHDPSYNKSDKQSA